MKTKTQELTGPALDFAVAECEGFEPFTDGIWWIIERAGAYIQLPKYSTDWAHGGPIIEREKITLDVFEDGVWVASEYKEGPTPLIAAMRCYVASIFGDEIEVPDELL